MTELTDKQKIKEEIERLINDKTDEKHVAKADIIAPKRSAYLDILNFINSLPEEPVSEDLEEYYTKEFLPKEWFAKPGHKTISQFNFFTAQHFAEWQRKKDQETIELAEDHAMLAGMNKMKEEMMKDAADSKITTDGNSIFPIIKYQLPLTYDCKIGDKVKLIIIKEE